MTNVLNLAEIGFATCGSFAVAWLAANGTAFLRAGTISNGIENGVGGTIEAFDLDLAANGFDNSGGRVSAGNNAALEAASADNFGGSLSAKNSLIARAASLRNDGGTIVGDNAVSVTTASTSPGRARCLSPTSRPV